MATLEQGTCRIHNGESVGTGFLIAKKYVLTCAHVIEEAIADDSIPIKANFLHSLDPSDIEITSFQYKYSPQLHEDIAVLELAHVPEDVQALAYSLTSDTQGHHFDVLGFPKGYDKRGAKARGLIASNQSNGGTLQLENGNTPLRIAYGNSGGAIWDTELNALVGIVVAVDNYVDELAYGIPMRYIAHIWDNEFQLSPRLTPLPQYFEKNPYKGLDYFHPADADRFYGRTEEIASLYEKIQQQDFIAVVGNSGTGKSSVVFAGLVPKLNEAAWCVLATRPADDPFHYLAKALVDHFEKDLSDLKKISEIKDYKAKLQQGSLTLADVATMEKDSRARQLVLIIDQFEELYTLNQDKAEDVQAYLEHLMAAIASQKLRIIITLRTDFLSNTHQTPDFAKLIEANKHNIYLIKEADKLAHIITLPDAQGRDRVQLEAGLKEKIVKDAKGELALLQFALEELWENRENNTLTHTAYDNIGGVEGALERKAENFMGTLPKEEQQQVRLIMLKLLKLGEGTEDTRRIATKAEIGEDNWLMVSRLADERLIKSKESDGEATAEVIHEALIRNWQTLKEWLTTDVREFLRWRENLKYQFNKWQSTQKPPSALLTGLWLTMARQYQQELNGSAMNNFNQLLNDSKKSYIQHSITSEKEKRQKEEMDREKLQHALNEVEGQKNIILGLQLVYRAKDTLFYSKSSHDYSTVGQLMLCESIPLLESSDFYNDDFLTTTVSALQRELKIELWGHSQGVKDICFSSNGEFLASAGYDKSIILWDLKIGENTTLFKHNQSISSICFSPNGKLLACACDETLRVLDIEQRRCIAVFECGSVIRKVDFGSNELLACACDENLEIWHITKGARTFASQNKFAQPTDIQFSPNNKLLASTHYDGNILLWHINQKNNDDAIGLSEGEAIPRKYEEAITSLDFTSDGKHLLITSYNGYITLWSIQGEIHEVYSIHYDKSKEYIELTNSAFNPDRKSFVISAEDTSLQVYDIETGKIQNILSGHSAKVTKVAFRASGELASASQDGSIKIWDYVHPQRFMDVEDILLHGYDSGSFITSLCTDTQERLFVGDSDGILSTYDLTNKSLSTLNTPVICDSIIDMDISADNSLLAIANNDGTIRFWDVTNDEKLKTYITHNELGRIRVNSSKDFLALVHNTTLEVFTNVQDYLYHNQEASLMKCEHGDRVKVKCMCFSPTDKYLLAYVDSSDTLRLWNIKTNKLEIFPTERENIARDLSKQKYNDIYEVDWLGFDPKGELLIFVSGRREVQFWCLESHQLKFKLMHEGVKHVRLSPASRFLITIAKNNEIKLWDMMAKKEITNLPTYNNNNIDFVDFIFDNTTLFLLIANKNGKIHILDLTIAHWIDKLCHNTGRNFFKPEWQEYLTHFITWEDYVARGGTCSQYPVLESIEDYANLNN